MWLRSEKKQRDLRHRKTTSARLGGGTPYKKPASPKFQKSTRATQVSIHNHGASSNNNNNTDKSRKASVKITRNNPKCNNNNNGSSKNLRSSTSSVEKKKLNHRNLLLLDDSKENCWQPDDVTLFVDAGATTKGKGKGKTVIDKSAASGIGYPNDALNHFGPINLNTATHSGVVLDNSDNISSSSCVFGEENVLVVAEQHASLVNNENFQSSKCVSECDSTTEFENECVPSTSCMLAACHVVEPVKYHCPGTDVHVVVPEVDSTTELLAGK
jgi:hypothetical protein